MSYCRTSEQDSDVYLYGSGNALCCHVAWRVADEKNVPESFYASYENGNSELVMIGFLTRLEKAGVRVPKRAINRLVSEIDD